MDCAAVIMGSFRPRWQKGRNGRERDEGDERHELKKGEGERAEVWAGKAEQ